MSTMLIILLAMTSAWYDGKKRVIPNGVSLGGIGCGLLFSWMRGNMGEALMGLLFAVTLIWPYAKGRLGGGDVKLAMAYGTLLGPWLWVELCSYAGILGLLFRITLACLQRTSVRDIGVPYAVPLAGAALMMAGKSYVIGLNLMGGG